MFLLFSRVLIPSFNVTKAVQPQFFSQFEKIIYPNSSQLRRHLLSVSDVSETSFYRLHFTDRFFKHSQSTIPARFFINTRWSIDEKTRRVKVDWLYYSIISQCIYIYMKYCIRYRILDKWSEKIKIYLIRHSTDSCLICQMKVTEFVDVGSLSLNP